MKSGLTAILNTIRNGRAILVRTPVYLILVVSAVAPLKISDKALAATTYYVDCNGSDSNNGKSASLAWRSLDKANAAPLHPGDRLLFKRGCTWTGTLYAAWFGTPSQSILVGAYGDGALPKIQNKPTDLDDRYHNNVDITGSYLIIENIETTIVNPPIEPGCGNNPIGFFVGFAFRNPDNLPNGSSNNILRNSKATHHTAGVHLQSNTHHNRIIDNEFTDNNVMQRLTPVSVGAADDIGAWGILLKGRNHEIGYNYFSRNNALCTYDTNPQGNSVELYEARYNFIHHNTAVDDRDFSELGSSAEIRSEYNTFAYNLVVSSVYDAHFIITRGNGSQYGPVFSTWLYHNTVYFSGAESQALVCGDGCNAKILTARNNIFWAEQKAAFADARFTESHNIYWNSSGDPLVQFMGFDMSATSLVANPGFVSPATRDFRLNTNSPAVDAGLDACWQEDIAGTLLAQGAHYDIGAYEFDLGSNPNIRPRCNQKMSFIPFVAR